ncbi:MAG: group III truncated hemoglobin [Rhodoblastus sp.]
MSHVSIPPAPAVPAGAPGPVLPRAGDLAADFGGFRFQAGPPPAEAGVYVLTRRIGALLYPVFVGASDDLSHLQEAEALRSGDADGLFWLARALERQRVYIARDLVGKYDPPLNVGDRKGRAAPEIAALVPDRASGLGAGMAEMLATPAVVSEDEIARLVREFYAAAMDDDMIGPVFHRAVADWDQHYRIVEDFWSRTLLGTTRYNGSPFTPHLALALKPAFFTRWIELFRQTAYRVLQPAAAARAIAKVEHMSACFQSGLFPLGTPAAN